MVYKRVDGTVLTIIDLPMTEDQYDSHMMQFPNPSFTGATSDIGFKTCILVNEHAAIF